MRGRIYDFDDKLHIEFINAMDNEYFQAMYERIYYQNCRLRILSGVKSEKRIEETVQEHLKIIDACLAEKWTEAADAMREHLICSKRASFMTIIESGEIAPVSYTHLDVYKRQVFISLYGLCICDQRVRSDQQ